MGRPWWLHCLVLGEDGLHGRRVKGKGVVFLDGRVVVVGDGRVGPRWCRVIVKGGLVRVVLLVLDAYVAHGDQKANGRTVREGCMHARGGHEAKHGSGTTAQASGQRSRDKNETGPDRTGRGASGQDRTWRETNNPRSCRDQVERPGSRWYTERVRCGA
ncbi:hypothetical protein BC567DRAFT_231593, partial [Phyllosticta citribraziliensis]